MTVYAYCTLSYLKAELRITDTNSDAVLQDYIYTASEAINDYTGAIFAPIVATYNYDLSAVDRYSGLLNLNRDLMVLSGVSYDGTAQTVSDFNKSPSNAFPASHVYGTTWTATEPDDIGITGTWFYHSNYVDAWNLQGTLSGDIDDSTTTIPVTATGLEVGQLLQINDEILAITDTDGAITATRGANGSTAASHTTGDTVEYFKPERVVKQACARWAGLMYTRRSGFENVTFNPGGTSLVYPDIPNDVKGLLNRLRIGVRITTV